MARNPTMPEVLNRLKGRVMADLRVCLPARVESYDSGKQTIDAKPLVKDFHEEEDGTFSAVDLPVIPSVPVVFPGGGGYRMVWPLQKGDEVLIVFADRAIDVWQSQGGNTTPEDRRRHALADAFAIPGPRSDKNSWKNAGGDFVEIGKDSASGSDFVALQQKVKDELTAIRDTLNALVNTVNGNATNYNSHTHTDPVSGSTGTPSNAASTGSAPAAVGEVKSETVKVRG